MTPPPQPEYIITAQRLKDYEDNLPQYIIVDGCKCDRDTTIAEIRSHPHQSERDEVLDEKACSHLVYQIRVKTGKKGYSCTSEEDTAGSCCKNGKCVFLDKAELRHVGEP